MESWVKKNTDLRIEAVNNGDIAGKQFCKLVLNSYYGKTVERQEDRSNFYLVKTSEDAFINNASPYVESFRVINENLSLYKSKKKM